MITLQVAKKFLKELYRAKVTFILLFIFPFFFLLIFNVAFGTTDIGTATTYNVAVVNHDEGINESQMEILDTNSFNITQTGFGSHLIEIMTNLTYSSENHQPLFNLVLEDEERANELLEDESIDGYMIIPENFSAVILTRINIAYGNQSIPTFPSDVNATVLLLGNDNNANTVVVQSIISNVIKQYLKEIETGAIPDNVIISEISVLQAESFSIFDFIAAGIFVFATILSASLFSAILLTDWDHSSIRRVKIAEIKPWEYLAGYMITTFFFMQIQHIFLFAAAHMIFGFDPVGSYLNGYIILLLTSFSTYALVFTTSSLVKDGDAVSSLLGFASSILGFASNAFFSLPDVIIFPGILSFTSGSPDLLLWDIFPWTHAVNALRAIFLFDLNLIEVVGDIILLLFISVVWFVLSIGLFSKNRLQLEDE